MGVAFVIADLGMGGAEGQVCSLAAGLVRRGVEVQIIPMAPFIAEHPQLSSVLIPVRTLAMTQGRWTPGDFFRYLRTAPTRDHGRAVNSASCRVNHLSERGS